MASNTASLSEIRTGIAAAREVVLNERTLGQDLFAFCKQTFPQQVDLRLTNCTVVQEAESRLTVSGTFVRLFPWENVSVEFTLFDHPTSEIAAQRHSIFRITIPDGYSAYTYLNQYDLEPGELVSAEAVPYNPSLVDVIETINFNPATMVFSSIDYSIAGSESIFYPDSLKTLFPAKQVKRGINFSAALTLDPDLRQYLAEVFGGSHGEVSTSQGLISPGEYGLSFQFRRTTEIGQTIGSLNLEMKGISLVLPLTRENDSGLRILLDGAVRIKDVGFKIAADFNLYYQELQISFEEFPSLQRLITLAGLNSLQTYFPEPLASLLDIQLAKLGMVLNLNDKSVSEVSFSLTTQKAIEIIPQIISVKPSLDMQVYAPFDERFREIEGDLKGIWQLGKTDFETTLSYPSYNFYAGMVKGQSLDMQAVVERILPGIWLPSIQLTKMGVWGNFLDKSFEAEIEVSGDSTWGFELAGRTFALQSISMGMAYANQQVVSCTMDGTLILSDVHVFISAQYDTDQGWTLMGGTAIEDTINLTSILRDLLEGISRPDNLPDLTLKNIVFFAAPKTGEYSLSGQTAEDWQLTDKLSLKVEQFTAKKSKNVPVHGTLIAVMTIDQTSVRLSAEKAASTDGGWQFRGSTGPGQKIPVGKLIERLANLFGAVALPSAIASFTIEDLEVSFNTQSKNFTFTCKGQLQGKFEVKVTIDIKHQSNGSYSKTFGGQLTIYLAEAQPLYFTLNFHKEPTAQAFLATYHEPGGRQISIDNLLGQVFTEPITTGVQLTLKDALFAYSKDKQGDNFLFGVALGLDINLVQLPLAGSLLEQLLPGRQKVGIDDLRLLVTRQAFTTRDISTLNGMMPEDIPKLPLPTGAQEEQAVALERGLHVSAKLNLGETPQPLTLSTPTSTPTPSTAAVQPASAPGAKAVVASDSTKWFKVQRTLGPFRLQRLGVALKEQRLWFLLDASLDLLGLTLGLAGLGVSLPLSHPKLEDLEFDLQGLEIGFKKGPLEISGGLLRAGDTYTGMALLKTEAFTITGLGSYAKRDGVDSLFIYAILARDLGGPVFFHVTGLAAGFGYNRALRLPPIDQVQEFPLLEAAMRPTAFKDLAAISEKINRYIAPAPGEYWLAAGVRFTSFGLIESFALLSVAFGTETVIAILGLSTITVPRLPGPADRMPSDALPPIAYAELAFKVQLQPERGVLTAEARLTPNSYVFTKECKLTGGFAFYAWFGAHECAGDFVITLGGYHPKFVVPAHYPVVPRVALNWQVSPALALHGEVYFALTPTCLMAGGSLSALYKQGALQAWFEAYIDAFISWKPVNYEMRAGLRLGASYRVAFLGITFRLEMSAQAHFWGPPFAGKVRVDWTIFSFTIYLGASQTPPAPQRLDWKEFRHAFLPQAAPDSAEPDPLTIAITSGLIQEAQDGTGYCVVNPHQLRLVIKSAMPSTQVTVNGRTFTNACALGVRPMGIRALQSRLTITLQHADQPAAQLEPGPLVQNVPGALWSSEPLDQSKDRQAPELLKALSGIQCQPVPLAPETQDAITIDDPQTLYTAIQAEPCPWHYTYAVTAADYDPRAVRARVTDPPPQVGELRQGILQYLTDSRVFAPPHEAMTQARDAAATVGISAVPIACGLGMLPNIKG